MTNQNTDPAYRLLRNGVALIIAFTLLGTATLIYFGNKPEPELWASNDTVLASSWDLAEAKPTLEIVP